MAEDTPFKRFIAAHIVADYPSDDQGDPIDGYEDDPKLRFDAAIEAGEIALVEVCQRYRICERCFVDRMIERLQWRVEDGYVRHAPKENRQ